MYSQEEEIRKEKIRELRLIPVAIAYAVVSSGIFIFLSADNLFYSQQELPGLTRHLWLLATIFLPGLAILFFIFSLTRLIWLHIIAIQLKMKVKSHVALWGATKCMLISLFSTWLYFQANESILNNANLLNNKLYYRFSNADFLWDFGIAFLCLFIAVIFAVAIYGALELPFKAKQDAAAYMPNNSNQQGR